MYRTLPRLACAGLVAASLAGCAQTLHDANNVITSGGASAQTQREREQAALPRCDVSHGTLAVNEPATDWWTPLELPSPEAVVKLYVMKSGCFKLLDRGKGFEMAQAERTLAAEGALDADANLGKGQIIAADFTLVPDLVAKDSNSSGSVVTALIGGVMPWPAGSLISRIKITSKTADVALTLTDIRTTEQKMTAAGHGEHTDWALGGAGFLGGLSADGGVSLGAYQSTGVGQVIMLAYLDAYGKMVRDLGYKAEVEKPLAMAETEIPTTPR
jgi:hypothetical protein